MIILLLLIFLILFGVVASDVIATVAGGAIGLVIILIVLIAKRSRPTEQVDEPQERVVDGFIHCDDCKYCYGTYKNGVEVCTCLKGHKNPSAGSQAIACEEDFLSRR